MVFDTMPILFYDMCILVYTMLKVADGYVTNTFIW